MPIKNAEERRRYQRGYYLANQQKRLAEAKQWREDNITHYVVYKHTSPEGAVYIGEGTNKRPYRLNKADRSPEWLAAFDKSTVEIEILHKCDSKAEARRLEKEEIIKAGTANLINSNRYYNYENRIIITQTK